MLIISIAGLSGLFILNLVLGSSGFSKRHYWFLELEHFLGGFFTAMFFSVFFDSRIFILLGVAVVSFLWELAEYIIAKVPALSSPVGRFFHQKKASFLWGDTLLDIVLNFIGAFTFFFSQSHFL
jgi:hypothetical protein